MSKQRITAAHKRTKKQERREEERRQELKRQQKKRNILITIPVVVLAILAGLGVIYLIAGSHTPSGNQSAQANTGSNSAFAPINNVSCDNGEHLEYHYHIHLSVYIDGQPVIIPQNIGINTNPLNPCIYWLHTHDTSGIVHIESPAQHTYTLGNFFDVWYDRFAQLGYPTQLGLTSGWQIYVNGQVYTGNFRDIPMESHTLITMAYNSPGVKPETTYNWGNL